MASSREENSLIDSLAINKFLASLLAEVGLLAFVLGFAAPTELSLRWGAGFSIVGVMILVWEHGYLERLPQIAGPYRFVRNPHTLALWLISFGLAVAARSFPAVILSLILLPWLFYIDHEENSVRPDMIRLRYRFRVPALIPTLIPFEASPNQGFSWRRAVKIQKWPSRSRLVAAVLMAIYLTVFVNLNPAQWWGWIVAAAYFGIKLVLAKGIIFSFAFRKMSKLSRKSS